MTVTVTMTAKATATVTVIVTATVTVTVTVIVTVTVTMTARPINSCQDALKHFLSLRRESHLGCSVLCVTMVDGKNKETETVL